MKKALVLLLVATFPLIASADITVLDATGGNITDAYLMDTTWDYTVGTSLVVDSLCATLSYLKDVPDDWWLVAVLVWRCLR